MRRSQIETKFLKTKALIKLKPTPNYTKSRKIFCSTLYKTERRKYYESLDTLKPFLSFYPTIIEFNIFC